MRCDFNEIRVLTIKLYNMTREQAKDLFRNDYNSYGKPKAIMAKVDKVYDVVEAREAEIAAWKKAYQDQRDKLLEIVKIILPVPEHK